MSVSMALVPVALALRMVMGKENFDKWIRSLQVRHPTNIRTETELVSVMTKAGYDAEKWGGSRKTHIDGEREFFFWDLEQGRWVAIFGKSDAESMVQAFITRVETAAGRRIFGEEKPKAPALVKERARPVAPPQVYPTNFRDEALLLQSLSEYGLQPLRDESGAITCTIGSSLLTFSRGAGDAPFNVTVANAPDSRLIYEHLSTLDDDYRRCVQSRTYEGLLNRIQEKNLVVESEEVLEDNSIVITLTMQS